MVQHLCGRRICCEQRGFYPEILEHAQEIIHLASFDGMEEIHDEFLTVKFGAAVDEGLDIPRDQIAAELI